MYRARQQSILRWIGHAIRHPVNELNRWQRAARFAYDLGRHGARQLREDRAPQMAAALAYQTLFAMIPILIVAMLVVKGLYQPAAIIAKIDPMLKAAGLSHVTLTTVNAATQEPTALSLSKWIEGLMEEAARTDMQAIGWLGFATVIYAAISMLVTIENSFNTIYRAPEGRSWTRRVPLYWLLLTVSPIILIFAAVANNSVTEAATLTLGDLLGSTVGFLWSIGIGWMFWFAVYSLVPNTQVTMRTSAIGALVCVILLEIGEGVLGAYITNSFGRSPIYGSLGLIPLFMFWVYVMWLFVLFGLELSATLQFLGDRALEEIETRRAYAGLIDPAVVVSVMELVAEDFVAGRTTSPRRLTDATGVPERVVDSIVLELVASGLLHRVEREQTEYCLARAPEQITADELLHVGFRLADANGERQVTQFVSRMRDALRSAAGRVTLQSLAPVAQGP